MKSTINFYKRLYLFALIPVLGWIFCAILYLCFHKPALNSLEQLTQERQSCLNNLNQSLTNQTNTFSRLNQLIRTQANSEKQSEQLKHDCQILLKFIDPEEQIPPKNIIIDNEQNKQNDNLLNAGAQKPLSENNIINIKKDP